MFKQEYFAERLRLLRLQNKLSQDDLAKLLHVSKTYVSDIERCRRTTTLDKLVELADAFSCSTDYLLGITDIPERR